MKWLLARILDWGPRPEETIEERAGADEEPVGAESEWPGCSYPRLVLLVHDAAGPTAYQLHTFEDAPSAASFIQFWFQPRFEHGILAFWVSHEEPAWQADSNEERPGEVVILIRDEARPDIVYPFSYPDMGEARSWIAKEATRRLDLRLVLLYWAVPVRIETDERGVVRLSPSMPPTGRDRNETETGFGAEPALLETEEEVEDTGVVAELMDLEVEELVANACLDTTMLEEDEAEPREEAEPALPKTEEGVEDSGVAVELMDLEVEEPVANAWRDTMMREEVNAEPREEAGRATLQSIEEDGDQSQVVEVEGKAEVSVEDEETVEHYIQMDAPRVAEDGDTADEPARDLEEIPLELAKLLKVRRWTQLKEPFKGVGSSKGKF